MNNSKNIYNNDEIDLTFIFISLWKRKWLIVASTLICTILAAGWHSTLPTHWIATSYISTPSTYNFYKDIHLQVQAPEVNQYGFSQAGVYQAMKTDVFSTAVGVLAVKGVSVADPTKGSNVFAVSLISSTEESAKTLLKKHLETANSEAIAANFPELAPDKNIRAFNYLNELSDISTVKVKRGLYSFLFLGIISGFFIGCTLVLAKEFIKHLTKSNEQL